MPTSMRHDHDSSVHSAAGLFFTVALFLIAARLWQGLFRMHGFRCTGQQRQADPQPLGRGARAIAAVGNKALHLQLAAFLLLRLIRDALFLAVGAGRLEIQPGIRERAEFGRQGV